MSPKNSTSTAALKSLLSDAAPADQTAAAKASSSQTGQSSAGSSSADAAKVSAPAKGVAGKSLISSPVARVRTGDATPVNAQDKTRDKTAAKSAGKSAANSPNLPPASTTKPDGTTKKTPSAVGLSVSHAGSSGVSRNQPQSAETGKTTKTSDAGSGSKTLPAVSSSSCLPATATSIGGSSRSKPTGPKQTPSPPAASASVAPVVRQRFRPAAAAAPPTATIATPCSADKEAQERAHRYHLLANALNDTPAPSRPATVAAPPTAAVAKIESEANDNSMDSMSDEEYRQLYFPNAANTTNAVNAANTSMPLAHGTAANTSDGQGNTQLVPMDVDDPHTVVQPKAAKDPDDDVQPMQVDDSAWHAFQRIRRMIDEKPFRHPAINPRPRKYWGYLSETLYLRYSPFQFEREPNPDNPSWERKFRAATCPCKPVPVMDPAALKWTLPGLEPNQFPTRDW
ncbi:hypothetical protein BC831DRAFT_475366 [Entophlyctis helioformis]|nr:hypothetical protein BC831DRAFT_475366 [Entophlyctis helioformis]